MPHASGTGSLKNCGEKLPHSVALQLVLASVAYEVGEARIG